MTKFSRHNLVLLAMLLCGVPLGTSFAQEAAGPLPSDVTEVPGSFDHRSVSTVLDELQELHTRTGETFIEQDEIKHLIRRGGGGPCASCAAIIVLQASRQLLGMPTISNPHRAVIESVADQDALLNGRVTNNQFCRLLKFYEKHLDGSGVSIQVLSAPNSPHAVDGKVWGDDRPLAVTADPTKLQVLCFTVTNDDGEVLGRHFVIVKDVVDGEIHVVDPAAPTKQRRYVLDPGPDGSCERVFLQLPPDLPRLTKTFELNTVFAVQLIPKQVSRDSVRETDIESIKTKIDATAEQLASRGKLRSPRDWRRKGASFGLPGLDLPTDLGGSAWPAEKMLEVFRHAGRHDLNLRDVVGGAHSRILAKSDNRQIRQIARQVTKGNAYMAITITEPDHGTDFTSIQTGATHVEGGYILNGQKRYNARLDQASHVIVFAKSASGTPGRLSVFVLPIDAPGITIQRFGAHGLTGNSYGGLTLDNVFVPKSHRIGEEDGGYKIFKEHFTYWRLMQTAAAIGTAERALEMMRDRLRVRKVYGGPIGRFTHLQQPLGQHTTELKMAYALAAETAKLIDQGKYEEAEPLACGLKAEGIEVSLKAVDAAARAFGGEGYSDRVDIGDRLRDLNGLRIADGTTDAMRSAVVMHTHGKDFWNMAFKESTNDEATPVVSGSNETD